MRGGKCIGQGEVSGHHQLQSTATSVMEILFPSRQTYEDWAGLLELMVEHKRELHHLRQEMGNHPRAAVNGGEEKQTQLLSFFEQLKVPEQKAEDETATTEAQASDAQAEEHAAKQAEEQQRLKDQTQQDEMPAPLMHSPAGQAGLLVLTHVS